MLERQVVFLIGGKKLPIPMVALKEHKQHWKDNTRVTFCLYLVAFWNRHLIDVLVDSHIQAW